MLRLRGTFDGEYISFDPIWNGRDWIAWEAPQDAPDRIDTAPDTIMHPERELACDARPQLQLSTHP